MIALPYVCVLCVVAWFQIQQVHSEAELKRIMPIAKRHGVPITFRAAGTSLSGQALTDSVLLKLSHTGKNFRNYTIHVRPHMQCNVVHSSAVQQHTVMVAAAGSVLRMVC